MNTFVDESALEEFKIEAAELLTEAEKSLLALDRKEPFAGHYNSVFRVFHSLKGAPGMLELKELQDHMHKTEGLFAKLKSQGELSKVEIDFFLKATDVASKILSGEPVSFSYDLEQAPLATPPVTREKIIVSTKPVAFVVDDEPEIVEIISQTLNDAGFETRGFTQAHKAVAAMKDTKPSVVVTDYQMPEMSGTEFLKEVRKIDPETPVIMVTGRAEKDILIDAIAHGIYGVIEKPFNAPDLASLALRASERFQMFKLLSRSINMVMYQFSDLEDYLVAQSKEQQRSVLRSEIENLQKQFKSFRTINVG